MTRTIFTFILFYISCSPRVISKIPEHTYGSVCVVVVFLGRLSYKKLESAVYCQLLNVSKAAFLKKKSNRSFPIGLLRESDSLKAKLCYRAAGLKPKRN